MAVELVTGYKGKDHVTAEQWADFNRGIFGDAAILPVGNKMETAIQTANQITIKDGVAVIDGRQIYIGYGESENIAIQSGTQGMARRDIVVLEYTRNEDTGVEEVHFKVVTGTPTSGSAEDPAINNMDIRTGVSVSQKPFCRVRVNGTAIEGVDSLVQVKELKRHAFEDPVKNLTANVEGKVLDASVAAKLQQEMESLQENAVQKLTHRTITGTDYVIEGEAVKRFYNIAKVEESGTTKTYLPELKDAQYIWLDLSNSYLYNSTNKRIYPITYSGNDGSSCSYRIIMSGETPEMILETTGDWSGYSAMITYLFY